jgi:hypothetical protein
MKSEEWNMYNRGTGDKHMMRALNGYEERNKQTNSQDAHQVEKS